MTAKEPIIVGRAEQISLPEINISDVPARIDTGAKSSAVWVSSAYEQDGALQVVLFGEGSPFYTGQPLQFTDYTTVAVASSTGDVHERYKIQLLITLGGRKIRASFTLADRSSQAYPVLIGRNVLRGKFIVDVAQGAIARDAERRRSNALRAAVEKPDNEEHV